MSKINLDKKYTTLFCRIKTLIEDYKKDVNEGEGQKEKTVVLLSHQIGEELLSFQINTLCDGSFFEQLSEDLKYELPFCALYEEKTLRKCMKLASTYTVNVLKKKGYDQLSWVELEKRLSL